MKKRQLKAGQYCLKDKQVQKLMDCCLNIRDRLIIELAAFAGLRRTEIATLEVKDVDFNNNVLNVLGKGQKERSIPVKPETIQNLKFWLGKRKKGYVFPSKRKDSEFPHMGPDVINTITRDAGKRAGVKNPNPRLKSINPHSLRHYYARWLKSNNVRIETIAALLGHSDVKTTLNEYGNQSLSEIQDELEKIW